MAFDHEQTGALQITGGLCRREVAHPFGIGGALERAVHNEPHDNVDVVGHGYVRDVERVAVDQHRVAASRGGDAQLIHDAGGHSGGAVLGSLPEQRELDR